MLSDKYQCLKPAYQQVVIRGIDYGKIVLDTSIPHSIELQEILVTAMITKILQGQRYSTTLQRTEPAIEIILQL